MGGRTRGHEHVEVSVARGPQAALACRRRLRDRVDGLARAILSRARQGAARRVPQLTHRDRLADDHARLRAGGRPAVLAAPLTGGDEVRPDVAERRERAVAPRGGGEPAEPTPGDVLEEDALDGLARAELEHLLPRRLGDLHHASVL